MPLMKRRTFLTRSSAALSVTPWLMAARSASSAGKKYRGCIIGDTKRGGYGHDLHLLWGLRDDIEVVALADPDEEGRARRAREAGAARTYADYREMLEKERPDLVSIGPRWSIHHLEYLRACAEVGAHGILEKPFTPDLEEGDAALAATENRNLKWAIAFNFRASPEVAHARRLLFEEGLIGDVLEVRARGKEDHRGGGEDLIVLGVHVFDMMIHFLGKPRWCAAELTVQGRPVTRSDIREATEPLGPVVGDDLHAVFGFAGGIPGYFASRKNTGQYADRWGLDIYGRKGLATIRMDRRPMIAYLPEPSWTTVTRDIPWRPLRKRAEPVRRTPEKVGHYAPLVDDLIAAIEEDRRPAVSLHDGLAATEMIQAVFETALRGGRVQLPLPERSHPLNRW